jgi:hypothetical protein
MQMIMFATNQQTILKTYMTMKDKLETVLSPKLLKEEKKSSKMYLQCMKKLLFKTTIL